MRSYKLPFDATLIEQITRHHPTPFYLYDEAGMRNRIRNLLQAFAWNPGFKQYFAVKANPNPHLVAISRDEGCGGDCSSVAELIICNRLGMPGHDIMFTSNNTTVAEFAEARKVGAVINLDHPIHIANLQKAGPLPEIISFRFNPGPEGTGNVIIGDPKEAKFGCTRSQVLEGYQRCKELGIQRFGLHTMVVSNELRLQNFIESARMLFKLAVEAYQKHGVKIEFVNLGGGIGLPYRPDQEDVDLPKLGEGVRQVYEEVFHGTPLAPSIYMENGRAITGPFGYLVTKVLSVKETYKKYVGVDGCMSNLMRPGMYGAYHHISILGKENSPATEVVDVVGSLCENNDKFAIDRSLPPAEVGDTLVIHDAGAHGYSMGFQYNGRLRSAEFLLEPNAGIRQIRRAETLDDYFRTVEFPT